MSASLSSTCCAAGPSGTKLSALATRVVSPGKPTLDQCGDDSFADPARLPGLVDHQGPARTPGRGQQVGDRQRGQPAQVEHVGADSHGGSRRATRRLIGTPLPKVIRVIVGSSFWYHRARPIGTWAPESTASQPPSASAYRSRRW